MNYYEIVKKLIGEIEPVGETEEDEKRMMALLTTIGLVNSLISDISDVAKCSGRHEWSMQRAGKEAAKFLRTLKESLEEEAND